MAVEGAGAIGATATVSGSAKVIPGGLKRQIRFLLDEAEKADHRLGALEGRVDTLSTTVKSDIERVRTDLLASFAATRELYINPRLWGIILLALGGAVQAAANVIA